MQVKSICLREPVGRVKSCGVCGGKSDGDTVCVWGGVVGDWM